MLGHMAFTAAGVWFPALPWGPLAALLVQGVSLLLSASHLSLLRNWWRRSKRHFLVVLFWQLAPAAAINTGLMVAANWVAARV